MSVFTAIQGVSPSSVAPPELGPSSPGTVSTSNIMNGEPNGAMVADWTNADNVKSEDEAFATSAEVGTDEATYGIYAHNFGFTVPMGATIDGVVVEVKCKRVAGAALANNYVDLQVDSDLDDVFEQSFALTGTNTYHQTGDVNDTFGASLTPSIVNSSDFGVVVFFAGAAGEGNIAAVDHIRVTIYATGGEG